MTGFAIERRTSPRRLPLPAIPRIRPELISKRSRSRAAPAARVPVRSGSIPRLCFPPVPARERRGGGGDPVRREVVLAHHFGALMDVCPAANDIENVRDAIPPRATHFVSLMISSSNGKDGWKLTVVRVLQPRQVHGDGTLDGIRRMSSRLPQYLMNARLGFARALWWS